MVASSYALGLLITLCCMRKVLRQIPHALAHTHTHTYTRARMRTNAHAHT